MIAHDLIETARLLVPGGVGSPRQSDLRRAVSTAYYAAFHRLAQCCADRLVGVQAQGTEAWRRVYRSLNHATCKNQCRGADVRGLSNSIRALTDLFVDLYEKRNRADYDPAERLAKSRVVLDLERITEAISRFDRATSSDQRTLSVFLLFRER